MATGGSSEEDPHICAVCLGRFRDPRLFSCFHTFCTVCIQGLANRHPSGRIPCPSCRKETPLPPGGVFALQKNFYLPQSARHMPGTQDMCKIHPKRELEFLCVRCDNVLCLNCKLTEHEQHPTQDLTKAASGKKKELEARQQRLQSEASDVMNKVTSLKKEKEDHNRKRESVEKEIHRRHSVAVEVASRKRDEALLSLDAVFTAHDSDIARQVQQQESRLESLLSLQQGLHDVLNKGSPAAVVAAAREDPGGAVRQLPGPLAVCRPVLYSDADRADLVTVTGQFLGTVRAVQQGHWTTPQFTVTQRFRCSEHSDVEVFGLCHKECDPPQVIVSYSWNGAEEEAPVEKFTEEGRCVYTGIGDQVGKRSYKRVTENMAMYATPQSGWFITYCKSPTAAMIRLDNNLTSGMADVKRVKIISVGPLKYYEETTEFSIKVGPHRAFDVDSAEKNYVVLEEGQQGSAQRSVHLFQRSGEQAVSTYSPTVVDWQPSDVCFHTLAGTEYLLVADKRNDAIHVVSIRGTRLHFERFLCPGCPALIQPSALAVDVHGRLWVACSGGAILTFEEM